MTGRLSVSRVVMLLSIAVVVRGCLDVRVTADRSGGASSIATVTGHTTKAQPTALSVASLTIEHVSVIAGDGSPPMRDATIVIRDRRTDQIVASVGFKAPPDAQRVDATGRFAIRGLWDMHLHLFNNVLQDNSDNHAYFFPPLIANGIVVVRDTWTDAEEIIVARRWERGDRVGEAGQATRAGGQPSRRW